MCSNSHHTVQATYPGSSGFKVVYVPMSIHPESGTTSVLAYGGGLSIFNPDKGPDYTLLLDDKAIYSKAGKNK